MTRWDDVQRALAQEPHTWVVTGAAGFIGSHLVERLLSLGQHVRALDNLATGRRENLARVAQQVGDEAFARCDFVEGDINDGAVVARLCEGADFVLHQAALGSVPRSLADPLASHRANVDGFLVVLDAARRAGVRRFVYASSSSVYGDEPALPKVEGRIGRPLSPYAATKRVDEVYAGVFQQAYGIPCVGLRYFNVFGPRQDPAGPYAAVIPRWVDALLRNDECVIFGDGETSRDFCYVDNAVQANILSALADETATDAVYNVAFGQRTTLLELYRMLREQLAARFEPGLAELEPRLEGFRPGDVRHSLADISAARERLGYEPTHDVKRGIAEAVSWYVDDARARA